MRKPYQPTIHYAQSFCSTTTCGKSRSDLAYRTSSSGWEVARRMGKKLCKTCDKRTPAPTSRTPQR